MINTRWYIFKTWDVAWKAAGSSQRSVKAICRQTNDYTGIYTNHFYISVPPRVISKAGDIKTYSFVTLSVRLSVISSIKA